MLNEYLKALLLIFAAEMGDKTQILAMMFATKYKVRQVLLGVFIGSLMNHGIAVLLGSVLGNVIPIYLLQTTAGIAFIGFALWTLMVPDDEEDEEEVKGKGSAVMIVAMAFFIGELGDKTQLTAITLALDAMHPVWILLGTVSGMVLTSSIGIFVGSKVGDRLPEVLIKIVSSTLFLIFGTTKLIGAASLPEAPALWRSPVVAAIAGVVVIIATVVLFRTAIQAHKQGQLTPYRRVVRQLYDYAHRLEITADSICRGVKHCGTCMGEQCAVGFIRHMAKEMQANGYHHDHEKILEEIRYYKDKFDQDRLLEVKSLNDAYLAEHDPQSDGYKEVMMMNEVVQRLL